MRSPYEVKDQLIYNNSAICSDDSTEMIYTAIASCRTTPNRSRAAEDLLSETKRKQSRRSSFFCKNLSAGASAVYVRHVREISDCCDDRAFY